MSGDHEKLREVIARARARRNGMDPDVVTTPGGRPMWMHYLNDVECILAAIQASGFKVLAREPTEEMIRLGYGGTDLVDASCTPAKDFGISDEEWERAQLKEMRLAWGIMWDAAPSLGAAVKE